MLQKLSILALFVLCVLSANNVKLDFFVMSLCPYAAQCELLWNPVIKGISPIVDLNMNFIASVESNGFKCMHGPNECQGDIQQLCAHAHYPNNNTWWNFIQCQDQTQNQIPGNGPRCAQKNGMDNNVITSCMKGSEGNQLMKDSISYTNSKGVHSSCTININDATYCVILPGESQEPGECKSKDPKVIIKYICSLYKGTNKPPACN